MMKWLDKRIEISPPKRPKKVTGTRFASILGLNPWASEFEMWLAITRVYEEPFVDNKYTIAGKAIEPKVAQYLKENYLWDNLLSPEDVYGKDYFNKTWGDFFPDSEIFGGMWDFLLVESDGSPTAVIEVKTTKRAEDWIDKSPDYYALQASLYAYLLGIEDVYMTGTFLEDKDYDNPSNFVVTHENTIVEHFNIYERFPNFDYMVETIKQWWQEHVKSGRSPLWDERKDKDLLDALRTNNINPDTDIKKLVAEFEELQAYFDERDARDKEKADRQKIVRDLIRDYTKNQFREDDDKVEITGSRYILTNSKNERKSIDKKKLEADGLLDKYETVNETYTLRIKEIK